jgi:hypothetical protein
MHLRFARSAHRKAADALPERTGDEVVQGHSLLLRHTDREAPCGDGNAYGNTLNGTVLDTPGSSFLTGPGDVGRENVLPLLVQI